MALPEIDHSDPVVTMDLDGLPKAGGTATESEPLITIRSAAPGIRRHIGFPGRAVTIFGVTTDTDGGAARVDLEIFIDALCGPPGSMIGVPNPPPDDPTVFEGRTVTREHTGQAPSPGTQVPIKRVAQWVFRAADYCDPNQNQIVRYAHVRVNAKGTNYQGRTATTQQAYLAYPG